MLEVQLSRGCFYPEQEHHKNLQFVTVDGRILCDCQDCSLTCWMFNGVIVTYIDNAKFVFAFT